MSRIGQEAVCRATEHADFLGQPVHYLAKHATHERGDERGKKGIGNLARRQGLIGTVPQIEHPLLTETLSGFAVTRITELFPK